MKDGFRVIDGDAHMQEPMDIWEKYVEAAYKERGPQVVGHSGRILLEYGPSEAVPKGRTNLHPDVIYSTMEARYGEAWTSWWPLSWRLKHMDQDGIDIGVGFPTNGSMATSPDITDPKLQAALCRAYNNWATDYCHDSRGRVKFIAKVTMLDVDEAMAEIRRVEARPDVAAVVLPQLGPQELWSDEQFDPLWRLLCDHGLAACFHGGDSQRRWFGRWREKGMTQLSHAIAFPVDTMLALGTMIFGGVLERFPELRVGFYEANAGWVPWWLARMDDHAVGRQAGFMYGDRLPLKPSEYFCRQCFVACDADEGTLADVVRAMHGRGILFNSDYPHPDAPFPGSVEKFLANDIPDDAKRRILWDNPAALYGERLTSAPTAA